MTEPETPAGEEQSVEEWFYGDPVDPQESEGRRWMLWLVAAITAVALSAVPLYNLFQSTQPQIADNGLEVCGADYCVVQDAVAAAGLLSEMVLFSNTYLTDEEAATLVASLVRSLGEEPVALVMVDRLDGEIAGQYNPSARTIYIERPATAWIVVHEVAHVANGGHGEGFQSTLEELVLYISGN